MISWRPPVLCQPSQSELAPGTNVLKLSVRGVRTDGATAKDQDRLTFKVP